ncbi:MAG: chitobiase/beta-hexosaminidase C-terminal domain-containing protein [Armatimonadetes bacterium]|nr:chitobiase/beta-hexosaminidase C-terminal domain-containing protein [Armatimonadota bacterium]
MFTLPQPPVSLVPKPAALVQSAGSFTLDDKTAIGADATSRPAAQLLTGWLQNTTGQAPKITSKGSITLKVNPSLTKLGAEGYLLEVSPKGVSLSAPMFLHKPELKTNPGPALYGDYFTLPRAAALAEVAWTSQSQRSFADFTNRMQRQYVRYTTDGTDPTASSPELKGTVTVTRFEDFKAITLAPDGKRTSLIFETSASQGGKLAEMPPRGNDSRAVADPRILALIRQTRATAPNGFTEASAKEVVGILLEDGKLDPVEYDLLDELTQPRIRAISLATPGSTETIIVGTQSGTVHKVLSAPLDDQVRKLLDAPLTQANWASLVERYVYSVSSAVRTVSLLQRLIAARWEASSISNAYEAYAETVGKLFEFSKALPIDKQKSGRLLLYQACKGHDGSRNDVVPDFLYNWVRQPLAP